MRKKHITKKQFISAVKNKLSSVAPTIQSLSFGNRINLHNESGLAYTFSSVIKTAENFYDMMSERNGTFSDDVASKVASFSSSGIPGAANVADVATVGAMDVTIMSKISSLIPFLCIDRPMANPSDIIYYKNIIASNAFRGINAGDTVQGNFRAPNTDLMMSNGAAATGSADTSTAQVGGEGDYLATIALGNILIPGTVIIKYKVSGGTEITGYDVNKDGTIYFNAPTDTSVSVNYNTGLITFNSGDSSVTFTADATANPDSMVDQGDPDNTVLRVSDDWVATQLDTKEFEIIYEQNQYQNLYMNRIQSLSAGVSNLDFSAAAFDTIANLYIDVINRDLIRTLISQTSTSPNDTPEIDLSGYAISDFSQTKHDLVTRFITEMKTEFVSNTDLQPTVIVAGSSACNELQVHPTKWVPNPSATGGVNGIIGTFDDLPVYRSNLIDSLKVSNGESDDHIYMGSKTPDNQAAGMAYGEFLPLTQTPTVGNYQKPTEQATGFFSKAGIKSITDRLAIKGTIVRSS